MAGCPAVSEFTSKLKLAFLEPICTATGPQTSGAGPVSIDGPSGKLRQDCKLTCTVHNHT